MDKEIYIKQLQAILDKYSEMSRLSEYKDLSSLAKNDRQSLITRSIAAIHRITGISSTYSKEILKIQTVNPYLHKHTTDIIGVVQALKEDIESGYLDSLIEVVHRDIFADFLEMATHLNENGYKDPAAVIAGTTLENHLKQLATKNKIALLSDSDKAKKASTLNSELAKADVYEKLDNKNVTAWLDLRNKAAHGEYDKYNSQQVEILITSIQDFITRRPA